MDVLDCVHGRDRIKQVVAKLANAVRPDGLLIISVCHLPIEMQHAWWARWLIDDGNNLMEFAYQRLGLRLVHQEQYPEPGHKIPGYLDHTIAIFEKVRH